MEMAIEKINYTNIGYEFNAKITFNHENVTLDEYHLDILSGIIACLWNSNVTVNLYGENGLSLEEIDNEWFDEEIYDKLYGIEQKRIIESELLDDAKEVFEKFMEA